MNRPRTGLHGICALALTLGLASGGAAHAGAWTQNRGDGLLLTGLSYHWLDAPGGSRLRKTEYSFYGEYGLTGRVTLTGRFAIQSLEDERVSGDEGEFTNALLAIGGTEAAVRMRLASPGRWVISGQVLRTFQSGGENRTNARFGTGGGDVELRLLAGRSVGRDSFVDVQVARRDRSGRSGEEWRVDLTAGTALADRWRVMAQTYSLHADARPDAAGYTGHRAQLSVVYDVPAGFSVSAGLLSTLSARNLANERAAIFALWRRF